jgi:hypothetical protein
MKAKWWIISIALLLFVVFVAMTLRPVPIPEEKDCLVTTGIVVQLHESGTKDITIRLRGNDHTFYINRGVEAGLDVKKLRADLVGNVVTLKYPDHWTPLDPSGSTHHVCVVELNGEKIFNELTNELAIVSDH